MIITFIYVANIYEVIFLDMEQLDKWFAWDEFIGYNLPIIFFWFLIPGVRVAIRWIKDGR